VCNNGQAGQSVLLLPPTILFTAYWSLPVAIEWTGTDSIASGLLFNFQVFLMKNCKTKDHLMSAGASLELETCKE